MNRETLKLALALIMIVVGLASAGKPRNTRPETPDQIYQNDIDLFDAIRNAGIPSKTKAELNSMTPASGRVSIFYCSDCSTDALVVSTGPAQGAWGRVSSRTTAIN